MKESGARVSPQPPQMTDPLEQRVLAALGSQYEVQEEIGRGGMSVVFRARDIRLDRPVAIKVLPPELAYDPAIRTRFTREAQTSAHLAHPHIVPIHDVGEREGIAYFVMSLVSGGNLASLLAREPRQPVEEVRRVLAEIADALSYAHMRGVVHRDIKPDNVLLDADTGRVVVTDFGIARAIEGGSRLTLTGMAMGTPAYMSPEQAEGEREIDGRSDIYSLGVVAYQMLTGRVPFTGGNSMALLLKHVTEKPRPIAELRPDAPRQLSDAIERALEKSPEDRWPSAAALREAVESEGRPTRSRGPAARAVEGRGRSSLQPGSAPGAVEGVTPDGPGGPGERSALVMQPPHLAALTPDQRADLRLWHGRTDLYDRVKAIRGYGWLTLAATIGGAIATVGGLSEGVPPAALIPIIPGYMSLKLWRRGKSLRAAGLKLRRVFLMPRARWVMPRPKPSQAERELEKHASRETLASAHGPAIRRALEDQEAILRIFGSLAKPDRAMIPDMEPTVRALVERVAHLAQALHRLDQGFDPRSLDELNARIAEVERDADSPDAQRRISLLQRQQATLQELVERRNVLLAQLDNASLALGNLRLDLLKFRSSGMQSAMSDVSSATQEARALSREIGMALEAASEMRKL
jgi:predicted Ser/Thr protein kinase